VKIVLKFTMLPIATENTIIKYRPILYVSGISLILANIEAPMLNAVNIKKNIAIWISPNNKIGTKAETATIRSITEKAITISQMFLFLSAGALTVSVLCSEEQYSIFLKAFI
jgi:hypothetical protein